MNFLDFNFVYDNYHLFVIVKKNFTIVPSDCTIDIN